MLYFNCDYTEGAHPHILEKMQETNLEQTIGYGEDEYCEQARALIRRECGRYDVDVHFLVGGTQANFTVIRASLRSHQGVIAPVTGHINGHETGAVEATGHKVLAQACGPEGKLTADQVEQAVTAHWTDEAREHLVQPKMVYISHPTENGALYTLAELEALSHTCREHGLYLFLDGARLGYGLTARGSDVSMADLARLCDAFYIGGTKCGALFGEAVVIANPQLKPDFRYSIKQNGGMLAKGRLLGIQFLTLFEDQRAGLPHCRSLPGSWVPLFCRVPHQPAVPHLPQPAAGPPERKVRLLHLGEGGRRPHRYPPVHQLGHPGRGRGTANRRHPRLGQGAVKTPLLKKAKRSQSILLWLLFASHRKLYSSKPW